MKSNAVYHVTKVITDNTRKKNAKGVLKEQYITLGYQEGDEPQRLKLRRITLSRRRVSRLGDSDGTGE